MLIGQIVKKQRPLGLVVDEQHLSDWHLQVLLEATRCSTPECTLTGIQLSCTFLDMEYLNGTYREKKDAQGHVFLRLQRLPRGGGLAVHAGVGQQGGNASFDQQNHGEYPKDQYLDDNRQFPVITSDVTTTLRHRRVNGELNTVENGSEKRR